MFRLVQISTKMGMKGVPVLLSNSQAGPSRNFLSPRARLQAHLCISNSNRETNCPQMHDMLLPNLMLHTYNKLFQNLSGVAETRNNKRTNTIEMSIVRKKKGRPRFDVSRVQCWASGPRYIVLICLIVLFVIPAIRVLIGNTG